MKKQKYKQPGGIGRIPLPRQVQTSFKDKTKYNRKQKGSDDSLPSLIVGYKHISQDTSC